VPAINLQHEPLGFVLFPLSPAAVAPHVAEYIIGFDFDEVRDVYGERFAVFWRGLVGMFAGQPATVALPVTGTQQVAGQQAPSHLATSEGGRRFIAEFFATEMRRHDFTDYISTRLAADFACALAQHLGATGKQQVDAVRVLPAEWRARAGELDLGDEIGLTHHLKLKDCADELEAALAARQPAVPVASVEFINGHAAELVFTGAALPDGQHALYTAPPAQGIDLGQQQDAARWRWVREQSGVTVSVEEADDDGDLAYVSGHTPEELDAAIDGQRDAAPGVDNG
jgi:hypothetical protein